MPFNISEFKATREKAGILRTHDYMLRIPYPTGLVRDLVFLEQDRTIELSCDSCNFPLTGVHTYGVQRYGYGAVEQRPTLPKFSPLQCTFYADAAGDLWRFFHEWLKVAVNLNFGQTQYQNGAPASAYEINYKLEYAVDIHLHIFDQTGNMVRHVGFREAYPTDVGDIALSWGRLNEMVKIPVMFSFFDWHEFQAPGQPIGV